MALEHKGFIIDILEKASEIARNSFGKVSGSSKSGDSNQVLTVTDLEIGRLLVSSIIKKYPAHNIIDEEAGTIDNSSKYTWVTDPIDGISNFAKGIATYGILVGLLENDLPILGSVSLPECSEIYFAEKIRALYAITKEFVFQVMTD